MKRIGLWVTVILALCPRFALAQAAAPTPPRTQTATDEGIPVTSDVVKRRCGSCHKADEQGRMTRISYRRTTPEGWEQTIKRMVSLNNVVMNPTEAREVLRYLSDHLGLAPEEAKPAAFEAERRMIEYKYTADRETETTCTNCHSMGRILQQRRTKEEWQLLLATHRALYPGTDAVFRRNISRRRLAEMGPGADTRQPMDKAVEHLSTAFPLTTPEWAAWSVTMRPPQLQGRWALVGHAPGKGPVFGQVVITAQNPNSGEFATETTFTYARTGEKVTRRGRSIVYTGFQWRGRSNAGATPATGTAGSDDWREVMSVDRDWRRAEGRWFWGAYNELGLDVRLERLGTDPVLLGTAESMVRAGAARQELHLFGANLPANAAAADVNFGPGITVDRIVSSTPNELVVSVSVAQNATPGRRSVILNGATGDASVAVYDRIDFIRVRPQSGISRLGGGASVFPKQFQQFEAVAYANGPDRKPDSKDDIELGLVDASWSLEEYTATYADDDKEYVGTIDGKTGLFTPNVDGPNPKRKNNANNFGDVWVVATYTPPGSAATPALSASAGQARSLKGRAHLLVTVPVYMIFDQPEVAR
jgi:quinohemoprotein amine dehydrogenase